MRAQEQIKVAKNKAEEEGREWTGMPDNRVWTDTSQCSLVISSLLKVMLRLCSGYGLAMLR
jgi:hypothetical protein